MTLTRNRLELALVPASHFNAQLELHDCPAPGRAASSSTAYCSTHESAPLPPSMGDASRSEMARFVGMGVAGFRRPGMAESSEVWKFRPDLSGVRLF